MNRLRIEALGGALAIWAAIGWSSGTVWAATSAPTSVSAETLLVIPSGSTARVFEEITFTQPVTNPVVGVLAGAANPVAMSGKLNGQNSHSLRMAGRVSQVDVAYMVPVSASHFSLHLEALHTINRLDLLVEKGWIFPSATNPDLQFIGQGAVLKNSSVIFNEYQTDNVHINENLQWSASPGSPTVVSMGTPPPAPKGQTTESGAVVLGLLGALAGCGWWLVYQRRQRIRQITWQDPSHGEAT